MNQLIKFSIISFLILVVGIRCDYNKTLEKTTEERELNGLNIIITANKVKRTQYIIPKGGRLNFELGPKSNYYVNYSLEIEGTKEMDNLCKYYVEKEIDLQICIKSFSVSMSENKQHLAVGINSEVRSFQHLISDRQSFTSGMFYLDKIKQTKNQILIGEINWTLFPDSESLFDSILLRREKYADNEDVLAVLKELPLGNRHEIFLIGIWYNPLANTHFTKSRVQKISKASPQWKNTAINKSYTLIEQSVKNTEAFKASIQMLLAINDKNALHNLDNLFVFEMQSSDMTYDNYFYDRIYNKKVALQAKTNAELIVQSEKILTNYSDYETFITADFAIEFLLKENKQKVVESFLSALITNDGYAKHKYKVIQLSITNYKVYPDNLQKMIVAKYTKLMENPSERIYDKTLIEIYKFLYYKIPCETLKLIYGKNEKILKGVGLPTKCKD